MLVDSAHLPSLEKVCEAALLVQIPKKRSTQFRAGRRVLSYKRCGNNEENKIFGAHLNVVHGGEEDYVIIYIVLGDGGDGGGRGFPLQAEREGSTQGNFVGVKMSVSLDIVGFWVKMKKKWLLNLYIL